MTISCAVGVVAACAFFVACLVLIIGGFAVEWFLLAKHRRRTGQELVGPLSLVPGSAACAAGMFMIWPRLQRLTGQVTTIDRAPRIWRGVVWVTGWAGFVLAVSFPLLVLFMSDSCVVS